MSVICTGNLIACIPSGMNGKYDCILKKYNKVSVAKHINSSVHMMGKTMLDAYNEFSKIMFFYWLKCTINMFSIGQSSQQAI